MKIPPTRNHRQLANWINEHQLVNVNGQPIMARIERIRTFERVPIKRFPAHAFAAQARVAKDYGWRFGLLVQRTGDLSRAFTNMIRVRLTEDIPRHAPGSRIIYVPCGNRHGTKN